MKPAFSQKTPLHILLKSGVQFLKNYLFLLLLQFLPLFVSAQTAEIDSLKFVYKDLPNDTSKVNILNSISRRLHHLQDPSSGVYGKKALELSDYLDYDKGKAKAYQNLGFHFKNEEKFEYALQYLDSALIYYKKSGLQPKMALVYNYIGGIYFNNGDFQSASDNYETALKINKLLNIEKEIATNIYNIGLCYENLGNLPKALNYYLQSLATDELLNDKQGISYDYQAIATIYSKLDDFEKAKELYQKALQIEKSLEHQYGVAGILINLGINFKKQNQFEDAISCYKEAILIFQNEHSEQGLLAGYVNLGTLYFAKGEDVEAKEYLSKGIKLGQKLKSKNTLAETYDILSQVYLKANKLDSALAVAKKGLKIAEEINAREKITSLLLAISTAYKTDGNYKQALVYLEEHIISKDSLLNKEKSRQVKELQAKFETETKEQQITLLNQEKVLQASQLENKSLMQKLLYGAIGMIILFSFIGFRYTKIKQSSKRLLLNQQLNSQKEESERLQELDTLKGHFFSSIAHEFRTPLTLILGPLEHVIEEVKNKGHRDQLALVKSNASKLLRLINQLLDLSRLESGIIKLDPVQEDIIPFLKGITHSFHSLAEQKNIVLTFKSSEKKLLMDFDKDKTEKILLNLLSNAFKFTPMAGSIEVSVETIKVENTGKNHLKVIVKDSGPGIPENELSKVFNRFYQAANSQMRDVEGSGIGLALTKELVEVQGGTIDVYSDQKQGATFVFRLPVTNESPIDIDANSNEFSTSTEFDPEGYLLALNNSESSLEVSLPADQHTSKEIILVIEDNEDVRRFICSSLKQTYKIIEAADGEEGIAKAKQHIPDLIISDVMMPKKDGYQACKAIKTDEITSHIPVILLTAKAGLESKLEGLETGADDYLPKPFNTKELKVRMKNLIRLRKNLREKYLQNVLAEDKVGAIPIAPIEDSFLKKVREMVEIHLDEEAFSIEDLSRELGMSRTQVHRKLKALTNQSASQYMRMIRLQHAKHLLNESTNNVSEVAYKVGFSSPNYFSTCFTEFYGYAPSEQKRVG